MSTKGALWLRVPGPEAPMNERIDRIPRQPRVKLASPPWVFLWATRLSSSHLKPWQWASAHGDREKLLSVPQTKVTPFQLSLGNLFFSCCENWSGYRERHTGTVERQKNLLEIFSFCQVAPLCGLESRAPLSPKGRPWALVFFFSLLTVVVSQMWDGCISQRDLQSLFPKLHLRGSCVSTVSRDKIHRS